MRKIELFKTTTHRRTYNVVQKYLYADCSYCPWHKKCNRGTRKFIYRGPVKTTPALRAFDDHPNWKVVSRNKRQWMKKRFVERERSLLKDGSLWIELVW